MKKFTSITPWLAALALGISGCGSADRQETPIDDAETVRQPLYYGGCEVDNYGYQTGRCINLQDCSLAPEYAQQCTPGALHPNSQYSWCGASRVNNNRCLSSPE